VLIGEFNGSFGCFLTGLFASDKGTKSNGYYLFLLGSVKGLVCFYHLFFFRMDGNDGLAIGKEFFRRFGIVGK